MKKFVTVICVISIILTSAMFSVSAAETKGTEKDVLDDVTTLETEVILENETTELIEATTEAELAKPKKEFLTDSSYEEMRWSVECDTSPQSIPWEDLSPEDKADHEQWLADQKKKDEEILKEWVENRPLWSIDYRKDMDQYITSKVHRAAEAIVVAEIAALTRVGIDEVPLSITSEGKIVSETKIALPEEVIRKLATHYYEAYDLYQKATYGEVMYMYQDFILLSCKYIAEDEVWIAYFRTDTEKYPERDQAHCRVVLKSNGEFVGLGR